MSTESQGCSSPAKLGSAKVKKERLDFEGDILEATIDGRVHLQQKPPPQILANGFHPGDLLQDILKTSKYNSLVHHTPAAKHEKIRLMIEDSISEESRSHVQEIFSRVEQLKLEEKLLLYLKLPMSLTNPNGTVDPLRQPLNPLGNRYEIHQTIMWIKTHLEEDPEVSLPKQEVYDEYNLFCSKNSMKPLSTADFGKVMKQVYPRVRPRRLGTRGNSRYCYAGMRKRIKLDRPTLPSLSDVEGENAENNVTEEMLGAASTLIREWAETLLNAKFPTLCALGKYLVNNSCVDTQSLAAVCILSASGEPQNGANKNVSPVSSVTPVSTKIGKLREAQLQLQRKLQERELTRDQKYQNLDGVPSNQQKEKTDEENNEGFRNGNKKGKKSKANMNNQVQDTNVLNKINATASVSTSRQKKVLRGNNQSCSKSLQSNCDNIVVQLNQDEENSSASRLVTSDHTFSPKEASRKCMRKRVNTNIVTQASESSPEKQFKLLEVTQNNPENVALSVTSGSRHFSSSNQQSTKIQVILANNLKATKSNKTSSEAAAILFNQPFKSCDKQSSLCSNDYFKTNDYVNESDIINKNNSLSNNQIQLLSENSSHIVKEKLALIDNSTFNDYINGGNNSQEPEEELLQYFQQSNSSSSDMEVNCVIGETEQTSRQDKVSQLRIILQENLKDSLLSASKSNLHNQSEKHQNLQKNNLILPTLLNHNSQPLNTRRRVSFETNTTHHSQDSNQGTNMLNSNTVPQSPNTRRRIFNFTPISPGPLSPINGHASKSNSANASPFVSPRNTPVPRSRSNLQACGRSRSSHKILSRSISCNVACSFSRNDPFIVPTSEFEFISTRHVHSPLPLASPSSSSVCSKTPQASQLVQLQSQKSQNLACTPFLNDLATQEAQLLINYPSQENLQEIKNVYQRPQPTDQEISDLLHSDRHQYLSKDQLFFRSQSVPLHRMVNPILLSPVSTHHVTPTFSSRSFNPSTNSSIAPTPVPSEFNDFGSVGTCDASNYLLDVDPLVSSDNHQFLIEDKEIIPDNLNNIFDDILNEREPEELLAEENSDKERTINSNSIIQESLPNTNLANAILMEGSSALSRSWTNENNVNSNETSVSAIPNNVPKMIHSRSYPNTPLPLLNSSLALQYPEDSNSSRSYPTTPLHNLQLQETYTENNEPMLFNPTLNTLNLHNPTASDNNVCSTSVECNVADFLCPERDLPNDETNDLVSLANFDGLQDVETLSPLFTEVVESNH